MNIYKKNHLLVITFIVALILLCPSVSISQQKNADIISEIRKGNYYIITEDKRGSLRIKKEYRTPEIREALYQLLINPPKFLFKGEGLGYVYLLHIMGDVQETRAIPDLLKNCGDPGTARSLARMGEPALNIILERYQEEKKKGKEWIPVQVLTEMVREKEDKDDYVAKGEVRGKIKKLIVEAINSDNHYIRGYAVSGLGELASQGDTDVIPLIKKTAAEDPYFEDFSKDPHFKVSKRYKVREEAQKVLEKLKKEGKIKEK